MKITVLSVGKAGALLVDAIREYEERASRYWPVEFIEVRQHRGTKDGDDAIKATESRRLLDRVPPGAQVMALTRVGGEAWSSTRLARYLGELANQSHAGVAFLIGGALGLSDELIRMSDSRMRLSTFTLPHDFARLLLAEQLYRAGTIMRREPYHKGDG